tara:strand:+ start:6062 stop:6502 length:441 start_codon:yes stop_codon:yes gene_type:complete
MSKLVGIVMMSAFDSAWSLLKSQPVDESGKTFSPVELQKLRAFVNANIESPDPALRAEAEQLYEMLTDAMSGAYGARPESEPRAPPMPFYSSTDRGYDPEREMSMGETMGLNQAPKGVGVSKPMPKPRRTDDDEDVDPEGGSIAVR